MVRSKSADYQHKWQNDNRAYVQERARAHYAANAEKIKHQKSTNARHLRMEVILAYGGECTCCKENRYEFLAIDHRNNDGANHRKTVSAPSLPRWLKNSGYPQDFQILCHNCNSAKGWHGECPHEAERRDLLDLARSVVAEDHSST